MADNRVLDPDRPEFLRYYPKVDGSKALAGFMFVTGNLPKRRGRSSRAALTVWRYHVWSDPRCVFDGVHTIGFAASPAAECERGEPSHRSLADASHLADRAPFGGPFAHLDGAPPDVVVDGLEKRLDERGF